MDRDMIYEPSFSERLLILFWLVAVCVILVRSMRLAWQLFSFHRKCEFVIDGTRTVDQIAKSLMSGLFKREPKSSFGESLLKMDCINTRFHYVWEICAVRIQSTKTLASLTAILSFFMATL
jgi:hypothetical protein